MIKKLKIGLVAIMLSFSGGAFADPPSGTPGGVSCSPGCHTLKCSGQWCTACNDEGCHTWRDSVEFVE
jgi:hypothetical protein